MATINLTIEAGSASELQSILAGLAGAGVATAAAVEVKPAAKPAAKAADKPKAEEPKEEAAADGPSLDDCKAAMKTFLEANDRDALTELLGRFGIRHIAALPTAQYGEFIAACAG